MLEQIVRAFQSTPIGSQRRIVAPITQIDNPEPAILTWGDVGNIPAGVPQPDGQDFDGVGFNTQCCDHKYTQANPPPEFEDVVISDPDSGASVTVRRIKKISFQQQDNRCSPSKAQGDEVSITTTPQAGVFTQDGAPVYNTTVKVSNMCGSSYELHFPDNTNSTSTS